MDYSLLKEMCAIHAPSGDETNMREFLLNYVKKHSKKWKVKPKVIANDKIQDAIILVFGKPRTAIFAHMDSIGFTVSYGKNLVRIGGPVMETGYKLVGEDSLGKAEVTLVKEIDKKTNALKLSYKYKRDLERGTTLTFKPEWIEDKTAVQCCYMDNRLGIYNALKVAETLENGIICITCWEETGGGSAEVCGKYIYEKYKVQQALISDITWVTEGVEAGKGCAISMRDSGIPRKKYVNKIIDIAKKNKLTYQLEVESAGGSDGNALQRTPYPFDWCFVGAPESGVHSPVEKVHKKDIESMITLYKALMKLL